MPQHTEQDSKETRLTTAARIALTNRPAATSVEARKTKNKRTSKWPLTHTSQEQKMITSDPSRRNGETGETSQNTESNSHHSRPHSSQPGDCHEQNGPGPYDGRTITRG